jgi:hypothetical protein
MEKNVECSKWEEKAALLEEENRELLAKLARNESESEKS